MQQALSQCFISSPKDIHTVLALGFHVSFATPSNLYEDCAGCVTVHSPNARVTLMKAQLVHWLLQAPMHTRALATLKMQMVKTRLQKSKHTTSQFHWHLSCSDTGSKTTPWTHFCMLAFTCWVVLLHGIEDAVELACMLV